MLLSAITAAPLVTDPVSIFFIVLVIILLAPILLNKLKIPHIVGMIVAGVVIGPYGLNILADDSSFSIFGQVGILYLMFLAGLEIDMYHLRLNLKRGALFGVLTLLIPLALGVVTSLFLLHLDWITSLLLGSMYASHTLISYPVVARFGITKTPPVLMAIVGTIIAVIGALLVLAGVVDVAHGGDMAVLDILRLVVCLALYSAAVIYAFPRLTRMFFKRYSDKVTQYVFILALVFLASWGARLIGVEPVLGAFLAGLVLNRFVPIASPLMSSIEFVGNAIFIPYFLIGVGMMINVRVLTNGGTLLYSAIMLAVALAGKWIPAFITQKINGMDAPSRNIMFGLTTAHTAVALAVVTVGYNLHLLDERILNATVMVILLTCALAPIITSSASAKMKINLLAALDDDEAEDAESERRRRSLNTLIPVSNPLTVQPLVDLALLMRSDRVPHKLSALHVRNDNSRSARAMSKNALALAQKSASAADITIEALDRYDLNTVTGILNVIAERDVTDIVIGMHRRQGIVDSFFGSKADELLRNTNRMVVLHRCYIPLNTVTRIVVYIPPKAQYETGFAQWVRSVANLTRQLGCRVIFCCRGEVQPLIRGILFSENYGVRVEFRTINEWDDMVLMTRSILDDDLFIVVAARVNSVSYSADMTELPAFLERNCGRNNLVVIYPEQFGDEPAAMSFVDPLASDIATAPSPLWKRLKALRLAMKMHRRSRRNINSEL